MWRVCLVVGVVSAAALVRETPEIVGEDALMANSRTVQSVAASLGMVPQPQAVLSVRSPAAVMVRAPSAAPAVVVSHPVVAVAAPPPRLCGVCNKALSMARTIMIGEQSRGFAAQGLPAFVQGICADVKVDFGIPALRCDSLANYVQSLYGIPLVDLRATTVRAPWCCGSPGAQTATLVNDKLLGVLQSCRSMLRIDVECDAPMDGAPVTSTTVISGPAAVPLPVSPPAIAMATKVVGPTVKATAGTTTVSSTTTTSCACCGTPLCGCVATCTKKIQVDVTKHHEVHMYESKWKGLFFSLLKTIKDEGKAKEEDKGDEDIDEAVNYYNFLHKNDLKTSKTLEHEARGLRTRLEEEKEKSEKGTEKHLTDLRGKVNVLHKLIESFTAKKGGDGAAGDGAASDGAAGAPPAATASDVAIAKEEKGVDDRVSAMMKKIAGLEKKVGGLEPAAGKAKKVPQTPEEDTSTETAQEKRAVTDAPGAAAAAAGDGGGSGSDADEGKAGSEPEPEGR